MQSQAFLYFQLQTTDLQHIYLLFTGAKGNSEFCCPESILYLVRLEIKYNCNIFLIEMLPVETDCSFNHCLI